MWVRPLGLKGLPRLPPLRPVPHRARQPRGLSGSPLSRVRRSDGDGRAATVVLLPERADYPMPTRTNGLQHFPYVATLGENPCRTVPAPLAFLGISSSPEPRTRADLHRR
jgi:hypothetical protein